MITPESATQLVNTWQRQHRIDPRLYELLIRRLTYPPFSPYAMSIVGISAKRLNEMIASGEISRVRGVGGRRLSQLRQLVGPHHTALYVDVMQMARLGERNNWARDITREQVLLQRVENSARYVAEQQ